MSKGGRRARNTTRQAPVVKAWDGNLPIYASPQLLDWRQRAAVAREAFENLPEGPERDAGAADYMEILCESGR